MEERQVEPLKILIEWQGTRCAHLTAEKRPRQSPDLKAFLYWGLRHHRQ